MLRPFPLFRGISLVLIVALRRRSIRCNGLTFGNRLATTTGGGGAAWLARGPWTRTAGTNRLFSRLGLGRGDGQCGIVVTGAYGVGQTGLANRFNHLCFGWLVVMFDTRRARGTGLRVTTRLLFARLVIAALLVTGGITAQLLAILVIAIAFALAVILVITLTILVLTVVLVTILVAVLTVILAIAAMVIGIMSGSITVVGIPAIVVLTIILRILALAFGHLALCFTQHPGIMFGMLKEALLCDTVMGQLCVPR
jgi:hypothetical protein